LARTFLGLNRSVINGNTRSQLQWIENLAASVRAQKDDATRSPLPQLAADLRIRNGLGAQGAGAAEDAGQDEYTYELELKMHPPTKDEDRLVKEAAKVITKAAKKLLDKLPTGMKLGASMGELTVNRKGKNSPKKDWKKTYQIFAGGFGFALGLGEQSDLSGKASFTTGEEWTERDFVGSFKILDGGVWFAPRPSDVAKVASKGKDKRDWSKVDAEVEKAIAKLPEDVRKVLRAGVRDVALDLEGSGNHETQIVPFEAAKKVGTAVGGSFFCSFGWIRMPDDLVTVDDTRPLRTREMQIAARGNARAHFDLGAAILTQEGRLALRQLCAAELPWFLQDYTQLTITAHCDLVRFRGTDSDQRNMQLAAYRAANVHQAVKDILGDRLKIPDANIEEKPMGTKEAEEAARSGHEPYRNPNRRRVDVTMNGLHVLTLTEA
jgi:outer membrane protein OmpA-like peptidoglycan-associated protein